VYNDVFGIAMSLHGRRGFLPLRRAGPISMGSLHVRAEGSASSCCT
jgi:hypothetical protein